MAELVIARVDESGIRARDLSETKSAKNEIILIGHQADKGGSALISLNGLNLKPANTKGLNCINLSEAGVVLANTVFDFSQANAVTNFGTWLSGLTTGIVLMVSHTEILTNSALTSKMISIGCDSWEYYWKDSQTSRSSFAGVYDVGLKKLMTYQIIGNDTSIEPATIYVQYDTFADIGSTGYGYPFIWDENEIISGSNSFPTNQYLPQTTLSALGLSVGETVGVYAELFQDNVTFSAGSHSSILIQFYKDGVWKSTHEINNGSVFNRWIPVTKEITIPAGVNEISVGLYRYPQLTNSTGKIGAREVVLKTKKPEVTKTIQQHGGFGQWGFITSGASESSSSPTIATSGQNQELESYRYGLLSDNTYGKLSGNGYYSVPKWFPGTEFDVTQEIIWDVSNKIFVRSGQDEKLYIGLRTEYDPGNVDNVEGHIFKCGDVLYRHPEKIRYGATYTYRISVKNLSVEFYLDGVLVGTGVMSSPIGVLDSFYTGSCSVGGIPTDGCYGTIVELKMEDKINKANSRHYSFVLSGSTNNNNTIRGRSPTSGMEYQTEGYCDPSTGLMYSGIGSSVFPYGTQDGDYCYVTIISSTATLVNSNWIGNRYQCDIALNPAGTNMKNQFIVLNPDGGSSWLTSGNMSGVNVRIEYLANPPLDAEQTGVEWVVSDEKGPLFDGATWIDIPTVSEDRDYVLKVIRTGTSTGDMYILDGRTSVNTTNGYLIVDSAGRLTTTNENTIAGDFTIDTVNGSSFVSGTVLELNKAYVIAGRAPRMARIGARYDGAQGFKGRIWDMNLENSQTKDLMYWTGFCPSTVQSSSNAWVEKSRCAELVHHAVDVNLMTKHQNVSVINRNTISFISGGVSTGVVDSFGLKTGTRFRVSFDIKSDVPIELRCANTIDSTAPLIKSLPAGRNRGVVAYQHTSGTAGPGVYIRALNPVAGSKIQINIFDVYDDVRDGICNKIDSSSVFTSYDRPNIKIKTKKVWCPAFGVGFLDIPSWKPDPTNFRIHIRAVVGTPSEENNAILSGASDNVSGIYIDTSTDSKQVRVFGYNSAGVSPHSLLVVNHTIPAGKLFDIDVHVLTTRDSNGVLTNDRKLTVTVSDMSGTGNKWSAVGKWEGDGSEIVKYIGYRPTTKRYNADIQLVEFIDTSCTRLNTRRYDLTRVQNSKPGILLLQYPTVFQKLLKIGQGAGNKGWDNTVYPQVGFFKDMHYIDGQKLIYIRSTDSSINDIRLKFEGGKQPYGYITMEIWDTIEGSINNDLELVDTFVLTPTGSDAAGTVEYLSGVRSSLPGWFADTNAYKKVVLTPGGVGTNVVLTNFPTGSAWKETVY